MVSDNPNERFRSRRQRGESRPLPHSVEAERQLLASCLIDGPEVVPRCIKGGVVEDSFYDRRHALMYAQILALFCAGLPVEPSVLVEELQKAGSLEEVGGLAYVVELSGAVPTSAQASYFIERVREQALLRATIRAASAVVEECHGFTGNIDAFCAAQEERLLAVTRARVGAARASGGMLPRIMRWGDLVGAAPRPEPPQLVEGLVHRGGKVMLGGGSKSFKTWCLLDLALSVATGAAWWGLRTIKGRVLYVNFELQDWSFEARTRSICEKKAIAVGGEAAPDLVSWHLRGYAADLSDLIPQFLVQTMGSKYDMIILDPIYKCLGERDENANGEVAGLLNEVEALAVRSDAAVVFGHHFSKGNQAAKDARDRVSGAGAWTRDPDTVITLTPHEEEECFTAEFVLRDMKPRSPMVVRWVHPCMLADGKLDPTALRQPGAPNKWTVETLVDLLKGEKAYGAASGCTYTALESLAKRKSKMSESSFKRKLKEGLTMGRIEQCGSVYFVDGD